MPNSLYAATALRDMDFVPRCVPGAVWGPKWKIDRSDTFYTATASVVATACDPRDRVRAGCGQVLDHGKCKSEGSLGFKVIGAGRLS